MGGDIMNGTCSTCRWWDQFAFDPVNKSFGRYGVCRCPKIDYNDLPEEDGLSAYKGESVGLRILTGPKFGCVHREPATGDQRQPSGNSTKLQVQEGPASHGFPPTNEEEIRQFWKWIKLREWNSELEPDERFWLNDLKQKRKKADKVPPKHFLERFRRHKEQQTKRAK